MERFKLLIKAYSLARWLAEVRRGFSLFVYLKQTRDKEILKARRWADDQVYKMHTAQVIL